jgi:hypothetical protein
MKIPCNFFCIILANLLETGPHDNFQIAIACRQLSAVSISIIFFFFCYNGHAQGPPQK